MSNMSWDHDKKTDLSGDSKEKSIFEELRETENQFVKMIYKSADYLSQGFKINLEKSDLFKVGVDLAADIRFSGSKVLTILKSGIGDIFWDAKASSTEAQKELRRGFYAAKKKFKEQWPAVSPDRDIISKNAS